MGIESVARDCGNENSRQEVGKEWVEQAALVGTGQEGVACITRQGEQTDVALTEEV